MEQYADSQIAPGTQGTPYTAAENSLIEQIACRTVTKAQIKSLFPFRTVNGVKKKIAAARERLGLIEAYEGDMLYEPEPAMLDPDDPGIDDRWFERHCAAQARANSTFLAALGAA